MKFCQDHFHLERRVEAEPATRYCETCICSFCDTCARVHDERYPNKPTILIEEPHAIPQN